MTKTIVECLGAIALAGAVVALLPAQEPEQRPRTVTQSYIRQRQDEASLLVVTPDVGIEAVFTDAMALAAVLNERRLDLLEIDGKDVQQRIEATRLSLMRVTGREYRQALQALAGVKFVDVFGDRPRSRDLENELALLRSSMDSVSFAGGSLGELSTAGVALWGDGAGSVREGGGFSPLAQGPAPFEEKVELWFDAIAKGSPRGVMPRLLQLVLRLDGGDRKRARALVTATNGWWPIRSAASGPTTLAMDSMWQPESLCVQGAREDWLALQAIDEELRGLFSAMRPSSLNTAEIDAERWFGNQRGRLRSRENAFAAAAEFTGSPTGAWLSEEQCRRLRSLWNYDLPRACAQSDGNEPILAAVGSPVDAGGRKAQRFVLQQAPTTAAK